MTRDDTGRTRENLLAEIAVLSGLSPLLGPGVIRRALADVGTTIDRATPADYQRALPALEVRMRTYLPPAEVTERLAKILKLLNATP